MKYKDMILLVLKLKRLRKKLVFDGLINYGESATLAAVIDFIEMNAKKSK